MPLYKIETKNVLFIHVPKTGGSAIENFLSSALTGLLNRAFAGGHFPCSPQHFHSELLAALFPERSIDYSFSIVRNPLDRLISEYKFVKHSLGGQSFDAWARETFAEYQDNPYVYDNHIRPMNEFMLKNTQVFKYEEGFDRVHEALRSTFPRFLSGNYRIARANTSPASENVEVSRATKDLVYYFYDKDYAIYYQEDHPCGEK